MFFVGHAFEKFQAFPFFQARLKLNQEERKKVFVAAGS
jgi:hypothetical protein